MNTTIYGFLLTVLAGFSTLIGTIFIFNKKTNKEKVIVSALSFAAGVMITVSFTDLLPESFFSLSQYLKSFPSFIIIGIFFSIGVLLSMLIDKYLPEPKENISGLYRVGLISMLAIILHNIPEGIATFMATHADLNLGVTLAIAIALHNIPEGISISIPIYYATGSRKKAFFYTFISALSEPFGALLTFLFLGKFMNNFAMGLLFSVIAGIMMQISIYELLPTTKKYHMKKRMILFFMIGVIFMVGSHYFF